MRAYEIVENIKAGKTTALEVIKNTLSIIKEKNPSINAFVEIYEAEALARAAQIDASKTYGRLAGVPVGIKDNMLYVGHKATCASKMLLNHVSPYTAECVQRFLDEGAIIIGRLNMDEFAMGSTNQNSVYGPTKNPLDLGRVPGGSSGACAAAVAAGLIPLALGTDTGGSIRQPAAFCGVVGIKPTYGRVSRRGVVAFASSADQVGPIAANVKDAALALSVIAGRDMGDSTSSSLPVPAYETLLGADLKDIKIGIPENFFNNLNPEIKKAFDESVEKLKKLGAQIVSVELPFAEFSAPCYYILTSAEASANLERFDGIRYGFSAAADNLEQMYTKTRCEGFGQEVKRRIMIGHYVLSKEKYATTCLKAQKVRVKIKENFDTAFKKCDIILTPTTPTTAMKLKESETAINNYLADLYTTPANMADLPAISVNCGADSEGMPIGLQFYADIFKEELLFKAASAFEAAKDIK